jgi:Cys-rich protein (TIGR01571 family)
MDLGDSAPVGAWRDGLCDCCTQGDCHPSCCCSFWCPNISVGQAMTRMRLGCCADFTGDHPRPGGLSPFKIMVILAALYIANYMIVGAVTQPYTTTMSEDETPPVIPAWVSLLVAFKNVFCTSIFLCVLIARMQTRACIRNKHAIPEQCCCGCEDCCLSLWCACCTTSQMLRHAADYGAQSADCCSETGLSLQFLDPV